MTRRITLERSYSASLDAVWELWTTRAGIESWWGPPGFHVEVRSIDLRPGGQLRYAMIADGAEQIAFMQRAGMPTVTETAVTYTDVDPPRRLAYVNHVDFVPGLAAYDVATVLELEAEGPGVRLRLVLDPMHDDTWTQRAVAGWEGELGKLAAVLGGAP